MADGILTNNLKELSDEELVQLIQIDNFASFALEILFNRYRQLIKLLSSKYYIMGLDRDDIFQEASIGFIKAIKAYNASIPFRNFSKFCVNRHLITTIKCAHRQKHNALNLSLALDSFIKDSEKISFLNTIPNQFSSDPIQELVSKETTIDLVKKLNENLTEFEIRALKLVLEGLSHSEVGQEMGVSSKAIENAIHRVRKKVNSVANQFQDIDLLVLIKIGWVC